MSFYKDIEPGQPHLKDWFLPGGAVIADGVGKLRLRPPDHWRREILDLPRRPPSMNDNKIRSNWRGFHTHKKSWQTEIEKLLMLCRAPRDSQRALVGAFIRFDRRMSRPPDPSNYRGLIDKAAGDALVNFGAIPDDDSQHYFFGGVEFDLEKGPSRTLIYVYFQPKESNVRP